MAFAGRVTSKDLLVPGDGDVLIERLLRVVDEGRRTATYKLALLLALIDNCAYHPGADEIATRAIAARVVELYYPQSRQYAANDGVTHELRQISMKASSPLRHVLALRIAAEAAGCRTVADTARRLPDRYAGTLDAVEDTFVRYPIPLLQVVGTTVVPFLYDLDWSEGTAIRTLRRHGRDRIRLRPGVGERLVQLGPLLRPLIELHWTRDVARWSGVATEDDHLRAHLFGATRITFPAALRDGLAELQGGRCFYCSAPLPRTPELDHFLPWSRWPNDAVENLVAADRCNGFKSDHLVAGVHLARWIERLAHPAPLHDLAAATRWDTDPARSGALVRSTYGLLPNGTPLWRRQRDFEPAGDSLHALVAAIVPPGA